MTKYSNTVDDDRFGSDFKCTYNDFKENEKGSISHEDRGH